ncbi:MAG: hypothetical protein IPK26_14120 [Planctomycetes bacterium]|nr:hypothetical protein [Planctomycetota bacterium]
MHSSRFLLCSLLLAGLVHAQVTASWAPFGVGCPGTATGLGATQVLPAVASHSWGSGNAIPFGWSPNRYQQVITGSELPTPFTIAALALRQPHTGATAPGFTVDLEIRVGYTTRQGASLSTTFAANQDAGPMVTVLPRAQVAFPDQSPSYPQAYTDMVVTIPWPVAFGWVPQPGRHLLVDITVFGNSAGGGIYGYPLDNISGTWSLWGTPATATVANGGAVRAFGFVMGLVAQTNTAVPSLHTDQTPMIGDQFRVRASQCAPRAWVALAMGLSRTQAGAVALPFPLAGLGAPGCDVLVDPADVLFLAANSAGTTNHQYDIPNDIYLLRMHLYSQAFVVDPAANALGLAVSNGGDGYVGNQ